MKDKWVKKIRILTQALILSGGLNIAFLSIFFYFGLKEKQKNNHLDLTPLQMDSLDSAQQFSNEEYLSYLSNFSYRELLRLLSDKQLIEEGYRKRDLALGCLVTFHHFNIEKALSRQFLQTRKFFFRQKEKKKDVILFPGLSDYHYEGIIHYAYREKWPLTSQGLFMLLQKWQKPRDPTLEEACLVTPEFHSLYALFNTKECFVSSEELLQLMAELRWEFVDAFSYEQAQIKDLTPEHRRSFLFMCLEERSSQAAKLLLRTDMLYVMKKCSDNQIILLLELLQEQSHELEQFCVEMLKSHRSDAVHKVSAKKLYSFEGEKIIEPYDHESVLKKFVYSEELKDKWHKEENSSENLRSILFGKDMHKKEYHLVKDGDTLWKIARMYKIDIEELIRTNKLDSSDCIFPGSKIFISH